MAAYKNYLDQKTKAAEDAGNAPETISAEQALEAIKDATIPSRYAIDTVDASRWGLCPGFKVQVIPTDISTFSFLSIAIHLSF